MIFNKLHDCMIFYVMVLVWSRYSAGMEWVLCGYRAGMKWVWSRYSACMEWVQSRYGAGTVQWVWSRYGVGTHHIITIIQY